jgi:hypothetical protein
VHSFGEILPMFLLTSATMVLVAAALEGNKQSAARAPLKQELEFERGVVKFPKPTIAN